MQFRTIAFVMISVVACAQVPASWHDPSLHRAQFVTVEDGVRLDTSPRMAYDDFAPKLAETCHVYGVARRGYGASSRPESGYMAQRSGDDVLQVLDSLKLAKPVLVGHSFGGQDLTTLGAQHSDRIAGLVYLNSAEDDRGRLWCGARGRQAASARDARSSRAGFPIVPGLPEVAVADSRCRVPGTRVAPKMYAANSDGTMGAYLITQRVRDAIFKGRQ